MKNKMQKNIVKRYFNKATVFFLLVFFLTACGEPPQEEEEMASASLQEPPMEELNSVANLYNQNRPAINTVREPFTMIFASDSQLYWWRGGNCPAESGVHNTSYACIISMGLKSNADQYFAMASMSRVYSSWKWPDIPRLGTTRNTPVNRPVGLILNGDLTSFWRNHYTHNYEVSAYLKIYDPTHPTANSFPFGEREIRIFNSLTYGTLSSLYYFYPGLGNHDYSNNAGDCRHGGVQPFLNGRYSCAVAATRYIQQKLTGTNNSGAFGGATGYDYHVDRYRDTTASLSYYFDIANHRFIQLHLNPKYSNPNIVISYILGGSLYADVGTTLASSFAWLKNTLQNSGNRRIVLNMHDYGQSMKMNDPQFLDAISVARNKIIALFAGHLHNKYGHVGTVPCQNGGNSCHQIPVFLSGSAEYGTFLLANFGSNSMDVGTIRSEVWSKPRKLRPNLGSVASQHSGISARYISQTPAHCPSNFGGLTYVTWSGAVMGRGSTNGRTTALNYSTFYVNKLSSEDSSEITTHDNQFTFIGDAYIKGTMPNVTTADGRESETGASGAPTIEALNGKLYIFWKDSESSTIKVAWADCTQGITASLETLAINWSAPIDLDFSDDLRELGDNVNITTGLSSVVHNNRIFLTFLTSSGNLVVGRIHTAVNDGVFRISAGPAINIPVKSGSTPYGKPFFYKDLKGRNYLAYFATTDRNVKEIFSGRIHEADYRYPMASHDLIIGLSSSHTNNQMIAIARLAQGQGIKYALLDTTTPKELGLIYVNLPRASGYITRETILGNSDVALAKTNLDEHLIAFWIDANNNDLYGSLYLGIPDFMRNPGNNTKDIQLINKYQ